MSLMLRKASQEVLDTFSLQNYHTAINETSKALQIVGECGKPLITIHGITFNRITPTPPEIEFATELLTDFLSTHKVELISFIKKAAAFKAKPVIEMDSDDELIEILEYTQYQQESYFYLRYTDVCITYEYRPKSKVMGTIKFASEDRSPEAMTAYKQDKKLQARAKKYLKDFIAYDTERKLVAKMESALSTCEI